MIPKLYDPYNESFELLFFRPTGIATNVINFNGVSDEIQYYKSFSQLPKYPFEPPFWSPVSTRASLAIRNFWSMENEDGDSVMRLYRSLPLLCSSEPPQLLGPRPEDGTRYM